MNKNDEEIILEAYSQVNEGILSRARAGLNDSLLGRAVNAVGNVITGNTQALKNNLGQDSAHMKFNSLLNSHTNKIQKSIKAFIDDLIKSNVINQSQGVKAQADAYNALVSNLQTLMGQDKGTVLSNTAKAVGNVASNIGHAVANTGQTIGKAAGNLAAGTMNIGTAAKQQYNQSRMQPVQQTQINQ